MASGTASQPSSAGDLECKTRAIHPIHVPSRARDEGEGWVVALRVVGVKRKPERSVARALAHGLPTRHVPEGGGNRMTLGTTLPARAPATGHPSVAQPALCGKRVG